MKKHFLFLFFSTFISSMPGRAQSNFIGSGIALSFNGDSSNYMNLGDVYNTIAFPVTVEAWLYLNSYPSMHCGVFATENDESDYYGLWLYIHPGGEVLLECGDGFGSGSQDRRGFVANENLPLHQWIHVAVVCQSVTNVDFYFNGRLISKSPTDGGSSLTAITHSGASAFIGFLGNPLGAYGFDGQMDEMRLWDIARTQSDIRDYMCRKIDSATTGLIGYWTMDENYSGSTVHDHTSPPEDGTISSTVNKVTSGAPIGDESAYTYPLDWSSVSISETDPSGDMVTAKNVTGSPYGIHVYRIESLPFDTGGLDVTPHFYFGVFCAPDSTTPGYDVNYHYDFADSAINAVNESTGTLFYRNDGSVTPWADAGAAFDMVNDSLSKSGENNRSEYILDVKNFQYLNFTAADNSICEKFCTDFIDQSNNNPTAWYWLFPGASPSSSTLQNPDNICYTTPGVYDVTLITVNANGTDVLTLPGYITVYETPATPVITLTGYTLTTSSAFSYQWQLNLVDIPGATNQWYIVMQSGYYTIVVTDSNGCVNSATQYVLITSVPNLADDENTVVYPNPNQGEFTIESNDPRLRNSFTLQVKNSLGEEIYSSNEKYTGGTWTKNLSLANVGSGMLYIEIQSEQFCSRKKVLVIN
jgi:PKD repeat protein